MATVEQADPVSGARAPDDGTRRSDALRAASAWLIVALLVFLWWAVTYRALVEVMAEWQFAILGRYYPGLTVILVVLALFLPVAAVIGLVRRRRRRRDDDTVGGVDSRVLLARAAQSATRSHVFFLGIAIVTALVALGALLSTLWLPSDQGPTRIVAGLEGSVQPQGHAAYAQPYRLGSVSRIEENVGFFRRIMYVAPVYLPHQHDGDGFLTTVDPSNDAPLRFTPITAGVLVERGIPRELANLYRTVGIDVPDRSYLLMRDGATVRWRHLVLGVQIGLLAIVSLVLAILFRCQATHLRDIEVKRVRTTV